MCLPHMTVRISNMHCYVCYRYVYLKSVLRYKFLILHTYHPDTIYLHEQACKNLWLFSEAKRSPQAEKFVKHWLRRRGVKDDNITMDLKETGCDTVNWIHLAYAGTTDRLLLIWSGTIKDRWATISISGDSTSPLIVKTNNTLTYTQPSHIICHGMIICLFLYELKNILSPYMWFESRLNPTQMSLLLGFSTM
jgi:hypothetical protein